MLYILWSLVFLLVILLLFVLWRLFIWYRSPYRRWEIDYNIKRIVNSKQPCILVFSDFPQDLADEYIWQLKGYKGVSVEYKNKVMRLIKK